ncbi:MAG: hypothetical protein GF417_00010 [Candidatus Latescibacteria bacterium]|nr:hypothetical protein [bacterium]MBD3422811.1 hypothetical protein [Candidatus Latescibacterota bacterium]
MDLKYVEGDSRLHRADPAVKVLVLLLLLAASLIFSAAVNTGLAVLLVLLSLASGISFNRVLSLLKPVPLFVLIIIAANLLLVRNGEPYKADLARGIRQGLRVLVLILSAGIFWTVTDPARFSDSVLFLGKPLKVIGIDREDMALMLMIIFSFIPLTRREVDRVRKARMVRCGRGGWFSFKKGGVLPLILPLTASVLRRGSELELALSARYYGRGVKGERAGVPASELAIAILSLVIFLLGLYAKY